EASLTALADLGWEQVDIFNGSGTWQHGDLVVTTPWIRSEGADIVRHAIDNALNRPIVT
ncbi:unnamed protein product, partial [Phaeothamnion confervicola]